MDIDQLQQQWASLDPSIKHITPEAVKRGVARKSTAQDRLWRRYRRMGFMAIFCAFALFPMMTHFWGWPLAAAFSVYALLGAAMDFSLWRRVKAIDIVAMPVAEVASRAAACRRTHHLYMAILIPIALTLLGLLAAACIDDQAALWGMSAGLAVGLAVGASTYLRIMREYRHLASED